MSKIYKCGIEGAVDDDIKALLKMFYKKGIEEAIELVKENSVATIGVCEIQEIHIAKRNSIIEDSPFCYLHQSCWFAFEAGFSFGLSKSKIMGLEPYGISFEWAGKFWGNALSFGYVFSNKRKGKQVRAFKRLTKRAS